MKKYFSLIGFALAHGVMDFSTISVVFLATRFHDYNLAMISFLVMIYSLLAFGLQPFFGIFIDTFRVHREGAILGVLLALGSFLLIPSGYIFVIFAGIGSALFHVSAGSICLNISPGKTLPIGVFSAPGVMGLVGGVAVGTASSPTIWLYIGLLTLAVVFLVAAKLPTIPKRATPVQEDLKKELPRLLVLVLLLLITIAIRAMYGLGAVFLWQDQLPLFLSLGMAVVLGKIVGAYLLDKFDWQSVTLLSLGISIPILAFFPLIPSLAIIGVFLFSFVYALPLRLLSNAFRGRSALVFGIAELLILFQTFGEEEPLSSGWPAFTLMSVSGICLLTIMALLQKRT